MEKDVQALSDTAVALPPLPFERIDRKDSECLSDVERAKSDISKGLLVYSLYGLSFKVFEEELEELLNKFDIIYKPLGENCTGELNCYGLYMDSVIRERYGQSFFRNLDLEADHMYRERWATKTYEFWDLEIKPEFAVAPDSFVVHKLTLPKGWDYTPIHCTRQFMNFEFVIDTSGAVSDAKFYDLYNLKNTNTKYLGYLKQNVEKIIMGMEPWKPAELDGHKVKSWYLLEVDLDDAALANQSHKER